MNIELVPISRGVLEPIIRSNIRYVKDIEEFESIQLDLNETVLCFDDFNPCFYTKSRDAYGEYSRVKIYFYEDFSNRVQNLGREEFIEKCKKAGLSDVDIKIAEKFFIENMKNENVWDWILRNKIKDVELDTIRTIKWRLRKKLFPELIKHQKKKSVDKNVYKTEKSSL